MGRSVSIVVLVPRPEGVETDNIRVDVQKDGVRTTIADGVIKFQKDGMMISVFGGEMWGGVGGRLRVPSDEQLPLNIPWSVIDRPRLDFIVHIERDKSASDPAGEDFPPFEVVIPGVLVRPDPTPPR